MTHFFHCWETLQLVAFLVILAGATATTAAVAAAVVPERDIQSSEQN